MNMDQDDMADCAGVQTHSSEPENGPVSEASIRARYRALVKEHDALLLQSKIIGQKAKAVNQQIKALQSATLQLGISLKE